MGGNSYKQKKRGAGRFVQLHRWVMESEAWRTMKPGPRALFAEIKLRFNGRNNGRISMSQREASELLNVSRNTVAGYFDDLVEHGFIRVTEEPHLGPEGHGRATRWAVEDEPMADGNPPGRAFLQSRKKQNPCSKTEPPRLKNCANNPMTGPEIDVVEG